MFPGTASGKPRSGSAWTITQQQAGFPASSSVEFGESVAIGDFNGDGYADLAIGSPGASVGRAFGCGAVTIVYGSAHGLNLASAKTFTQASPGIAGKVQDGGRFGWSLAAADFNGDGISDLVVGEPNFASARTPHNEGAVEFLAGSPHGIQGSGSKLLHRRELHLPRGTLWGQEFAAGHFNGGRYADLAVSTQSGFADAGGHKGIGRVDIIYGGSGGLNRHHVQSISPASKGFPGPVHNQALGAALVAADFNGDGYTDLAIDARGQFGAVDVVPGSAHGLSVAGTRRFTERTAGVPGRSQAQGFGDAMAVRRPSQYSSLKHPMLYIGVPDYQVKGPHGCNEGAIVALHANHMGLTTRHAKLLVDPEFRASNDCGLSGGWGAGLGGGSHIESLENSTSYRILNDTGSGPYASTKYTADLVTVLSY